MQANAKRETGRMEIVTRELPRDCEIIDTGDWHIGVANTNESGIFEMIEYVASAPNRYLIVKGDLIDCISVTDKRFSLTSFAGHVTTPQDQADRVLEILRPIKDRILFLLLGNHEYKLINKFDLLRYWCNELEVPWGGVMAKFISANKTGHYWKGLFTHGSGTLRSAAKDPIQAEANMKANLKKKLQHLASDCIYMSMGHTHRQLTVNPTIQNHLHMIDDGERLNQTYIVDIDQSGPHINVEARWYCCSGSFLATMSQPGQHVIPYSEMAMYAPVEMGYLKIIVENHRVVWTDKVVV